MIYFIHRRTVFCVTLLLGSLSVPSISLTQDKVLISYGGFNESVGPMWVAVDKGLFKKYGLDVSMLQVRNGQVSLTALMSGDVQAFWTAVSSVLSGVSGGAKIGCVGAPFNSIARELIVRKEIESLNGLREKTLGVQSIGGGFWLQTMIVLDRLGVDPDKNGLKLRVIGDEPTICKHCSLRMSTVQLSPMLQRRSQRKPAFVRWRTPAKCAFLIRVRLFARGAIGLRTLRISSRASSGG